MAQENANSGIARGQVMHGARGYITINGLRIGYAEGIDVNQTTNTQDVEVLDNVLTEEHVATGIVYTGTISVIEVYQRSLIDAGIQRPIEDIFNSGELAIAIVDRPNGAVWRSLRRVTITGKSFEFRKGTLTRTRLPFKAIEMVDKDNLVDV